MPADRLVEAGVDVELVVQPGSNSAHLIRR
jgi:hypothetical protein